MNLFKINKRNFKTLENELLDIVGGSLGDSVETVPSV